MGTIPRRALLSIKILFIPVEYNIVFYFILYFVFENNDAVSPRATLPVTHSTERRGWSSASVTVPRVSSPLAPKPTTIQYGEMYNTHTYAAMLYI